MIFFDLFIAFLRVGCFAFGGGYAAIPLIRDVVLEYGWVGDEMLTYMIAVSESTPGPIMVNMATYVGSVVGGAEFGAIGGILGSVLATFAVVLPSFAVTVLIMAILRPFMDNKYVRAVLGGLTPCIIGIILAVGVEMLVTSLISFSLPIQIEWRAVIIAAILAAVIFLSKLLLKKKVGPIVTIIISAALGIVVYGI